MGDIKEMLDAVSLQLVLVIVMGIASIGISHSIFSGITTLEELMTSSFSLLSIASMLLGIASIVVIAWAGFVWAKESKGSAVDGGKAGALVSVISGIITGYLSMIYISPLMGTLYSAAGMPGLVSSSLGVLTYVMGIVFSAVMGFVLGAIGGHFGKNRK